MPRLSQWMVRVALLYLLLGFTVGALLLTHKGIFLHPLMWSWLPAHIEFLLMGWIVQLAMGVAIWIFPRYWQKPTRPKEDLALAAFLALNLGIWLVVAGSTLRAGRWALVSGRFLEITAMVLFAVHAWHRIVSREGA